jgi:type II secretory pathway pseudopilin PulG
MKGIRFHRGGRSARGGFNLVEVCLTIGIISVALLTLVPLMSVGFRNSSYARDDRLSAQIARTLTQEARQGTLGTGPIFLDNQGATCSPLSAAFIAQPVTQPAGNSASQLSLRITPVGAPGHARIYAVVLPVGAEN